MLLREPMEGVSVETSMHSGEYDIVANGILQEEELNAKTIVDCELRIPDTSYVKRKTLHYYPGNQHSLVTFVELQYLS